MIARRSARIRGVVQGVGFRPFVARLAGDLALAGRVCNGPGWVELEVEGPAAELDRFARRLVIELRSPACVEEVEWSEVAPTGERDFRIEDSRSGRPELAIAPDLASCPDCLAEIADPRARRFRYPFTNCTRCGPRFTISHGPPYDRGRTSMAAFAMCEACAAEYASPVDRRFHAQPIACPACGPSLRLATKDGTVLARREQALQGAIAALERGEIVAVQGLGGYQLVVRADRDAAVRRLRERKRRPSKPFALLVADLGAARVAAQVGDDEARALCHPAAPIVLLARRDQLAPSVAPGQHRLGVMLPATPLHALLAGGLDSPLVCTSGNLHDEPICIDPADALGRLGGVADAFLDHDRAILRRADDSVVHVVGGRMRAVRAARGLAPMALPFDGGPEPVLALGGHLKQTAVLATEERAVVWPQVGDLSTPLARQAMGESIADLESFLAVRAELLAVDAHPDYATTLWAEDSGRTALAVQHHHAHIAAVLAEHRHTSALGFAWDGVGYGSDGGVWGGEVLEVDPGGARRVGHLREFPLPGGDAAARDGCRPLAGLLVAAGLRGADVEPAVARHLQVAASSLAPRCTSVGRLFDAVAALTGVASTSSFEGEAAMRLEAMASAGAEPYPCSIDGGVVDWGPMLIAMLAERGDARRVASRFHATLAAAIARMAASRAARVVVLAGGCFHNALLLELAMDALGEAGVRVLVAHRLPAGDGGLALGQAWVACRRRAVCA